MGRDPRHPRPQLQRPSWELLDGHWDFALDADAQVRHPRQVRFTSVIEVPFAPETVASGIGAAGFLRRCWYRRQVAVDRSWTVRGQVIVHFAAVDREAWVWANGTLVGHHVGGYTPFAVDITDVVASSHNEMIELIVRADDEPTTLTFPRGKQAWTAEPELIWYARTTGIWQSVWLEYVPETHIQTLDWSCDAAALEVTVDAVIVGDPRSGDALRIELQYRERVLVNEVISVTDVAEGKAVLGRTFGLHGAAFDDDSELLWSPDHPALIEAIVTFECATGSDTARSYTAIRSIAVRDGEFLLHGQPLRLRFALDQGYWKDSGLTAPSVEHLRADVEVIKRLGLNGVRKHQKIEDPRWLAQCDELGLLVWEELPSAYAFSRDTVSSLASEWMEIVQRDRNHPCIIGWVPINESWGVPDSANDTAQRAAIQALAALTVALDPTRPVSANDGWETIGGDIIGVHDYTQDAATLATRYGAAKAVDALFTGLGPAGRPLTLDGRRGPGGDGGDLRAVVLTEFGGVTLSPAAEGIFGYGNVASADEWLGRIESLCRAALASPVLAGYCWTQLTDTFQEANGLLDMDRIPKAPIEQIRDALLGIAR